MIKLKDLLEGKLTEIKTLPSGEIQKRMRKSKYWKKVGLSFEREVGKKFRGRKVSEKALDKMLPDYIDGKQIHALFIGAWTEGKLTEGISVADTRFVGKFVIHILSSGSEMRSAILSKKNNSKYATKDKKDLKTLWDLAGKYKGKEIKEGKLTEKQSAAVQRMAKQGMWVVYDTPGEQTIKVVKNEKAAKMLIKKLKKDKNSKYNSPETKAIKLEGKLNELKTYEEILKQLGGNKFVAMTGAKNLATGGNKKNLSFSIGRNAKKVTHVIITLTSADLYDMEFINMSGAKRKVLKKVKGVYNDMLRKIFTKYTGMRTSL